MTIDPVIVLLARLGLGWLFLAAALHKLSDIGGFRVILTTYRVLPERLVGVAAWGIAIVECVIGIGALLQRAPAHVAAVVLLLVYAAAIGLNLARGRRNIDCGCGGAAQPLSLGLVARNVLLALGGIIALVPTIARPLGWLDFVSVIAGTAVLGMVYAATDQLLAARARLEEWV